QSFDYYLYYSFFHDTATTEIYTLSLHDALPILWKDREARIAALAAASNPSTSAVGSASAYPSSVASASASANPAPVSAIRDRMRSEEHTSNSSHVAISYAVFCLKKKKICILISQ